MSSDFDRSKLRGASIAQIQQGRKEIEDKSTFGGKKGDWVSYHKIDNKKAGKYVFRLFPAHNPENLPFAAKRCTFLEVEQDVLDKDRKPTGKKEIRKKQLFIATVHGKDSAGNPLQKDPVELYIQYVWKKADDEGLNKDGRKKFMQPVFGYKDKTGWKPGISASTNSVYYAKNVATGEIAKLELYPKDTQRMEEVSIKLNEEFQDSEEADNFVDFIDIFTDPNEGYNLEITIDPYAEKEKRKVDRANFNPKKFKNYDEFIDSMQFSDEDFAKFFELPHLKVEFEDKYTTREFNYALEGLQIFDAKNKYDIFENEDFLNELAALKELVKEPETEPNESDAAEQAKPKRRFAPKAESVLPKATKKQPDPEPEEDLEDEDMDSEEPEAEADPEPEPEKKSFVKKVVGTEAMSKLKEIANRNKK